MRSAALFHGAAELLATAEGQAVGGSGVPQVTGVGIAEAVVALEAETSQPLGAVTCVELRVLRRVLVARAPGQGVVGQHC